MTRFWSLMSSLDIILPHFYRFFVKVRQDKYIVNSDNVNHFGKNILFAGELLMENGQWKTENRADALVFTESGGILHYIYGSPGRNWEDKLSFSGAAAMQNLKCIMQNYGGPSARFLIISEGNTFILHFALCIQHLPEGQRNDNFPS